MTKLGLIILTALASSAFAAGNRDVNSSYLCKINASINNMTIATDAPNPLRVNIKTVDHMLLVKLDGVENIALGFSPYEGRLHVSAMKKNEHGRFKQLLSSAIPMGNSEISFSLTGLEGVNVYVTCNLE